MRAQTVNFERGKEPKDALGIGNKNARTFNKALHEKDYFAPVLENMLEGLNEGSVLEKDAVKFVHGAISKADVKQKFAWYDWFYDEGLLFWNSQGEEFIITFDLPEIKFLNITKYRKIRCKILKNEFSHGNYDYEISSFLQVQSDEEELVEEVFHQNNVFPLDDDIFTMAFVCKSISSVVEATIKNMD